MKGTVNGKDLAKAVDVLRGVVTPRATLPVLSCVMLDLKAGALKLTATNLEQGAEVTIDAEVEKAGSLCVNAAKLDSITAEALADRVVLSGGDARLTIAAAGGKWTMFGMASDDFPPVVGPDGGPTATISAALLLQALRRVSYCVGRDDARAHVNSLHMVFAGNKIRLEATDGHRLTVLSVPIEGDVVHPSILVPQPALKPLQDVLAQAGAAAVTLTLSDTNAELRAGTTHLVTRLAEGQFPNIEAVIPKVSGDGITLDAKALLAGLRKVLVMADDRSHPVKLIFGETLALTSASQDAGDAATSVPIDPGLPAPLTIGFNGSYLVHYLDAVGSPTVRIWIKDGLSPALLRPGDGEEPLAVIMPMRIN